MSPQTERKPNEAKTYLPGKNYFTEPDSSTVTAPQPVHSPRMMKR
jgi:hypothetical protein